jgi:hypothetical protein
MTQWMSLKGNRFSRIRYQVPERYLISKLPLTNDKTTHFTPR